MWTACGKLLSGLTNVNLLLDLSEQEIGKIYINTCVQSKDIFICLYGMDNFI